jgi:predicted house-cleaning noncanonical NTP pyrophosphatase (MazG superfamily)
MKKLVRDLIPQLYASTENKNSYYYQASDQDFPEFLKKKLLEEVHEFIASKSEAALEEELADILEVIDALYKTYHLDKMRINKIKEHKKATRGGFEKKLILVIDDKEECK